MATFMGAAARRWILPFLCVVMTWGWTIRASAQTPELPDFNSIRTPTSPAFTLLGVSPTAVERPNSPSDFALTLLDRTQNLARLPKDFALEVSPYWLLGGSANVTWQADTLRNPWQSLVRTLALSVATAEAGGAASPATAVALGLRANLFSGRQSPRAIPAARELDQLLAAEAAQVAETLIRPINEKYGALLKAAAPEQVEALRQAMNAAITAATADAGALLGDDPAVRARIRQRDDLASQRPGFWLEVAGAWSWRADSGVVQRAISNARAVWLTASYTADRASVVWVGRLADPSRARDDRLADSGLRAILTRASWALSTEYVRRFFLATHGPADQWRLTGNFDYRLSQELWVSGTFGRDFDDARSGSLLAQLGLSWHLSRQRYAAGQ